jgi:hypothetical protein
MSQKNPILDLRLTAVMRPEIALPLQQVFRIGTVGSFLIAWRNPKTQRTVEQVFDSPQQARHCAATCAAWLGISTAPAISPVTAWWRNDDDQRPTLPA